MHHTSSHLQVDVISFLNFAFLFGRKYFIKILSAKSFHVVIESGGREFNHALARSHKENRKSVSLNASCNAPAILKVSLTSKNNLRCRWGSSDDKPLNYPIVWSIRNITGLSSKLLAWMSRLTSRMYGLRSQHCVISNGSISIVRHVNNVVVPWFPLNTLSIQTFIYIDWLYPLSTVQVSQILQIIHYYNSL